MGAIQRFDHVGITVNDLAGVQAFFEGLGLEATGPTQLVEGHFLTTVIGIPDARVEVVMLSVPGGGTTLELSQFLDAQHRRVPAELPTNEPGLRNVCFEVDDLQAVADRVRADGYELVGDVADWEGSIRMCYVRGPEGIIVSLAQTLG